MTLNIRSQSIIKFLNRPEKGGSFRLEGKKEGVWGRNFCLPALLSFDLALTHTRRPKGGGRRAQERKGFSKFSWRLASMLLFEIGSNFLVQGAPEIVYSINLKPNRLARFIFSELC